MHFWVGKPGELLLTLEALRQLAVARAEMPEATGRWDPEMLRCARQILVRLEMIDDAQIRRTLSGFFHPVLTSLAAWRTATREDRLEGLCLFEMARSRWLIDHLALGNRTLLVRPEDDERTCGLKDALFGSLNPVVETNLPSKWEEVPADLFNQILQHNPDLARLVAASWIHPDSVRRHIPAGAVVLAYQIEHDPADPPRICLTDTVEPWSQGIPGPDARLWMFLLHEGRCHAQISDSSASKLGERHRSLQCCIRACREMHAGQPTYRLTEENVRRYEDRLEELARFLLHPWDQAGLFPSGVFPLLIVPSGDVFELPWSALPLRCGRRIIDVSVAGILPGLGLALWSSGTPPISSESCAEVFLQAAPHPETGLHLSADFLNWLHAQPVQVIEGEAATPQRALETFRRCDALIFLCHGQTAETPFLQLAPPGPQGWLTSEALYGMLPADHVQVVMLGACWSGMEVRHASEDVEGLASVLLLKGVRAVLAGSGEIPVELIAHLTAFLAGSRGAPSVADVARRIRESQREYKNGDKAVQHPWLWASIAFHGVPW
jgi:hypothetical protein